MHAPDATVQPGAGAWICAGLGAYALLGSTVALLGWALNLPRLAVWPGEGIAMLPNTGLAALCAGSALLLRARARAPAASP